MTVLNHPVQWYWRFSGSQVSVRITWKVWTLSSNGTKAHTNNMVYTIPAVSQNLLQHSGSLSLNQATGKKTTYWEKRALYWESAIRTPQSQTEALVHAFSSLICRIRSIMSGFQMALSALRTFLFLIGSWFRNADFWLIFLVTTIFSFKSRVKIKENWKHHRT